MAHWPRNGVATSSTVPSSGCLRDSLRRHRQLHLDRRQGFASGRATRRTHRPKRRSRPRRTAGSIVDPGCRGAGRPMFAGSVHGPCGSVARHSCGGCKPPAIIQQPYADQRRPIRRLYVRNAGCRPEPSRTTVGRFTSSSRKLEEADFRLKTLTVAQVDELLAKKVRDAGVLRGSRIQRWASALRRFFRFAEGRGWCRRDRPARSWLRASSPHEGLPVGPSWDDVKRLLAAARGGPSSSTSAIAPC